MVFRSQRSVAGGCIRQAHRGFHRGCALRRRFVPGIEFSETLIPQSGEETKVNGFELTYQQSLDLPPVPLDGVLVGLNYTYTNADGEIATRTIALPASSENTFNASLGYEKGPLSLRAAAAHRDRYLD